MNMRRNIKIVDAPSILGLKPSGVEKLPEALKAAGIIEKLHASYYGTIPSLPYNTNRDTETLLLNAEEIKHFSISLADVIEDILSKKSFPLVLGGDCSIVIGTMLALRRLGRYGLLFLDGHADFYQPSASLTGEVADMDLAVVTGRGPDILTNIEDRKPLVKDTDVVAFGYRDAVEAKRYGSQDIKKTKIFSFDLQTIQKLGIEKSIAQAVTKLTDNDINGFWIHLDVDVLDDKIMPAVDYRLPGGLTSEELERVLEKSLSSKRCVGLSISIFNPSLDDGTIANYLTNTIVKGFGKTG